MLNKENINFKEQGTLLLAGDNHSLFATLQKSSCICAGRLVIRWTLGENQNSLEILTHSICKKAPKMARYFDLRRLQKVVNNALQNFRADNEREVVEDDSAEQQIHITIPTTIIKEMDKSLRAEDFQWLDNDPKTFIFSQVIECLVREGQIQKPSNERLGNAEASQEAETTTTASNEETPSMRSRARRMAIRKEEEEFIRHSAELDRQARQACDKAYQVMQDMEKGVNRMMTEDAKAESFQEYQAAVADGECDLTIDQFHQCYAMDVAAEQQKLEASINVFVKAIEDAQSRGLDVSMYFDDEEQPEEELRQPMADFPYEQYDRPLLPEAKYLQILRWSDVRCKESQEMAKTIVSPTFEHDNPVLPTLDDDFRLHPSAGLLFPARPTGSVFANLSGLEPPAEDDMESLPEGPDHRVYRFHERHFYGGIDDPNNYHHNEDADEL